MLIEPKKGLGGVYNLLVIGNGGHGKDAVGDILRDTYGMSCISSSMFAAEKAVYPLVQDLYDSPKEAYEDRRNHRALWYHAIAAYNLRAGPTLAAQILAEHDVYTGLRARAEFEESARLFDVVVWVDASERCPEESAASMELTAEDADWIIDNNGPEDALPTEVAKFVTYLCNELGAVGRVLGEDGRPQR